MIELQLLGGVDIVGAAPSATVRSRRRHPMMLLALVAASAPQPVTRERLMAFLWPESDTTRASNSLRQVLHALRRELGEDLFLGESSAGLLLDPARISVDLWRFREATGRRDYRTAASLYRGPFLDGFEGPRGAEFARWVEAERDATEREYGKTLDALATEAETSERFTELIEWRRKQATTEPFSSRAALGLLKALAAAGDRPGALAYATVHENFLRAHLDVAPDPAVTDFVAELRRATPPDGTAPNRISGALALVPKLIDRSPAEWMSPRRRIARRWITAGLVATIGLLGAGSTYAFIGHPADAVLVLGSGSIDIDGRDTSLHLVSCSGAACPAGALPQAAFVIPTHQAYTDAAPGTHYIAPVPGGATVASPGYACCTTAVFEQEFSLPPDAASASIAIGVLADNRAIVSVNGVEIGRQADSLDQWNFSGKPTSMAATFVPDPTGTNRLRVTLWDGKGVTGLNYRAFVRFDRGHYAGLTRR
jgi:DNA-binding SARP family transcriptional activator